MDSDTPKSDLLLDKYRRAAGYMLMTTRERMLLDEYKQLERELAEANVKIEDLKDEICVLRGCDE